MGKDIPTYCILSMDGKRAKTLSINSIGNSNGDFLVSYILVSCGYNSGNDIQIVRYTSIPSTPLSIPVSCSNDLIYIFLSGRGNSQEYTSLVLQGVKLR